jgi:hypothetical protein
MGFANDRDRRRAIQETLDEASVEVQYVPEYGPVVCCPRCGAGLDQLGGWSQIDHEPHDTYAGFRCKECGFIDGGEMWTGRSRELLWQLEFQARISGLRACTGRSGQYGRI